MHRLLLLIVFALSYAVRAQATCAVFSVTEWSRDEYTHIRAAVNAAIAPEVVETTWVRGKVGEEVEVCAPTFDVATLNLATLRTSAATLHQAQVAADAARAVNETDAVTELDTSQFCRTATLAQIESRLDTQHTAMQADIDAINATNTIAKVQTAMTTMNNRRTAIDKATIRCLIAYIRHQQLRQQE